MSQVNALRTSIDMKCAELLNGNTSRGSGGGSREETLGKNERYDRRMACEVRPGSMRGEARSHELGSKQLPEPQVCFVVRIVLLLWDACMCCLPLMRACLAYLSCWRVWNYLSCSHVCLDDHKHNPNPQPPTPNPQPPTPNCRARTSVSLTINTTRLSRPAAPVSCPASS